MVYKEISPPPELVELVKKEDFGMPRKRKGTTPYVTDVVFCTRKAVYNRFLERPTDIDKMCKMGRGVATELYYLRKLPDEQKQVRVENEHFVGKLDGIIYKGKQTIGIEIKQSAFGSNVPSDYFVDQATIYSSMTGWVMWLWVHVIVYNAKVPSKANPAVMEPVKAMDHPVFYEVRYDPKNEADKIFLKSMVDRSGTIRKGLEKHVLPPKSPRFDFECKSCEHKALCDADKFPEIKEATRDAGQVSTP